MLTESMLPTLKYLAQRGCRLVLGLRDVMDAPDMLKEEWTPSNVLGHIKELYDDIWVYGPEGFWDPLTGFEVSDALRSKLNYLGFLRRSREGTPPSMRRPEQPYLLATSGGGGDGARMMSQIVNAYEVGHASLIPALLVLGPLMPSAERAAIFDRAQKIGKLDVIEFDNNIEHLIEGAAAMVGMCGYNTFCEALSFNKPSLIVPRTAPRKEQLIRATRASELGLVDMLLPSQADDAELLANRLRDLADRPKPEAAGADAMLGGLDSICQYMGNWADKRPAPNLYAVAGAV